MADPLTEAEDALSAAKSALAHSCFGFDDAANAAQAAGRLVEAIEALIRAMRERDGAARLVFKFDIGDAVIVVTHPQKPRATVLNRWPGSAWQDYYGENIYEVSGFVTKQRERSLAAAGESANG